MDNLLRVEPRKIEFTTYGPGRAPVWEVTFALRAPSGYEHQCLVVVPGHGHDDIAAICMQARAELFKIGMLMVAGVEPRPTGPEVPLPPKPMTRRQTQRPRKAFANNGN
ncbi:hypothetical protein HPGCJGGD_0184 [Methylobacterium haplocladii]|nr:hypothetical protein HPGCJGGD_0184 [Methylobacterium haplocladii]